MSSSKSSLGFVEVEPLVDAQSYLLVLLVVVLVVVLVIVLAMLVVVSKCQ